MIIIIEHLIELLKANFGSYIMGIFCLVFILMSKSV